MTIRIHSIILLFALSMFFTEKTPALEPINLQLRWHHGFQFAGYYMAKEKGFYQEAGLDISFLEGGVNIDHFEQVLNGQANYGVAGSELVIEYLKGKPFRSIGVIFQHSPYVLMVRKDSGLNNPQQLVEKTVYIGLLPRTAEIQAMLIQEGVPLKSLKVIDAVTTSPDYADPNIDAFSVYETNEPYMAKQLGIETLLIKPVNYGIDFYGDCLFSTAKEIKRNRKRTQLFHEATLRGWEYAFNHPEETITLVFSKYNTDNKSKDHLYYEYESMRQLILPDHIPIGMQNQSRWKRIAQTYSNLGMAPAVKDITDFTYHPRLDMHRLPRRTKRILGFSSAAVLTIFLLLFFWNRTLKVSVNKKTESLRIEIKSHFRTQAKLKESLTKYETLFNSFPLGITVSDEEGQIGETNWISEKLLGVSKVEHEKRKLDGKEWKIIKPDEKIMPPDEFASVKALRENRKVENIEMGIIKSNDEITWLNVTAAPIPLEGYGVVTTYCDISDRKQAEDRLKSSLVEKEILLRELYHRTKNTLQVIRSLLLLQGAKIPDNEQVQTIVKETENRIMAIALIHQKLYQSKDLSHIQCNAYIQELAQFILQNYPTKEMNINLQVNAEPLSLLIDTAIPCGLILNELLSNTLKYAFPHNQSGKITIQVFRNKSKNIEVIYSDNGVGVPADFDFREQQSMGLQIIIEIAEQQLEGKIRFESEEGITAIIEFPETLYKERVKDDTTT